MNNQIDSIEYILCAAIKRNTPRDTKCNYHNNDIHLIEIGYRHHDIFQRFGEVVSKDPRSQGFYTSKGRYVDRHTAMKIAYTAKQVSSKVAFNQSEYNPLYSEYLY